MIVIGPPRSGTSVIARLLQENLDVMMDEGPIKKDKHNPSGYYEDHRLVKINHESNLRGIKRIQMDKTYDAGKLMDPFWAAQFAKWITYRMLKYKGKFWGFKDPRMVGIIHHVKQFFQNPIWIVTDRKDNQILKSQVKKLGLNFDVALQGLNAYRRLIKKHLDSYYLIDLSKYRSEENLTEELREILWQ